MVRGWAVAGHSAGNIEHKADMGGRYGDSDGSIESRGEINQAQTLTDHSQQEYRPYFYH